MTTLIELVEGLALGLVAVAILFMVYMAFWVSRNLQRRK